MSFSKFRAQLIARAKPYGTVEAIDEGNTYYVLVTFHKSCILVRLCYEFDRKQEEYFNQLELCLHGIHCLVKEWPESVQAWVAEYFKLYQPILEYGTITGVYPELSVGITSVCRHGRIDARLAKAITRTIEEGTELNEGDIFRGKALLAVFEEINRRAPS